MQNENTEPLVKKKKNYSALQDGDNRVLNHVGSFEGTCPESFPFSHMPDFPISPSQSWKMGLNPLISYMRKTESLSSLLTTTELVNVGNRIGFSGIINTAIMGGWSWTPGHKEQSRSSQEDRGMIQFFAENHQPQTLSRR